MALRALAEWPWSVGRVSPESSAASLMRGIPRLADRTICRVDVQGGYAHWRRRLWTPVSQKRRCLCTAYHTILYRSGSWLAGRRSGGVLPYTATVATLLHQRSLRPTGISRVTDHCWLSPCPVLSSIALDQHSLSAAFVSSSSKIVKERAPRPKRYNNGHR